MISPQLTWTLAQTKIDDLRRSADARGPAHAHVQPDRPGAAERNVTLRLGSVADERKLARLAALDSADTPGHPVLLAEVDGQLLAALALSEGDVVADPFYPTADLVDLLRARARQLKVNPPNSGRYRRRRAWSRLRATA